MPEFLKPRLTMHSPLRRVYGKMQKLAPPALWKPAVAVRGALRDALRRQCESRFVKRGGTASFKRIPIIINNRNRFTYLKAMLHSLEQSGHEIIVILDNASTYEPLLEFYRRTPHEVVQLGANVGHHALWISGVIKRFRSSYFVYSDPDIVPVESCPDDFLRHFYDALQSNPTVQKVGFGLLIDDLPECYANRDAVLAWEGRYWKELVTEDLYRAPIDTTFALYRPWTPKGSGLSALRTGGRYVARHMPWYVDSSAPNEEEKYYEAHAKPGLSWWSGDGAWRKKVMSRVANGEGVS